MHFLQRCCIFFAVTDILIISINLLTFLRDLILAGPRAFLHDPLDGYFWKLIIPLAIIIIIISLVSAVFLYKGAVNKNEKHFLPWLIVHGFFSGLASIGCLIALFYPEMPSFVFKMVAILTSISWARWIIANKCRNNIKNEALNAFNKLHVNDLILKV